VQTRMPSSYGASMHSTDDVLIIDCDQCRMQHTDACDDCVVTFLCTGSTDAVVVDVAEARALRLLADSGLAPPLRLDRRTG